MSDFEKPTFESERNKKLNFFAEQFSAIGLDTFEPSDAAYEDILGFEGVSAEDLVLLVQHENGSKWTEDEKDEAIDIIERNKSGLHDIKAYIGDNMVQMLIVVKDKKQ